MFLKRFLKTVKKRSQRDDFCGFLTQTLGRKPKNKALYSLAFVHKSASVFHDKEKLNNERLEYLGDAILGAIVADILYKHFPKQKEGFLTKLRSKIVSREQLNHIGKQLHFQNHIQTQSTTTDNIIGNTLEAFIGALYLDLGYRYTRTFIANKIIKKHINFEELITQNQNFKSKLLEWGQHKKKKVIFQTSEAPNKKFYTQILIDDKPMEDGYGYSKKKSQQKAADKTLKKIEQEQ